MSMHLSRPARRAPARGAGILEVIIAMAVLAVAAAGAVMGLLNASRQVRDGQLFQEKRLLAEARLQRLRLADKTALVQQAVDLQGANPQNVPVGTAPWQVDATPAVPNDPASGAYFVTNSTGELKAATGIAPGTACNATAVPRGTLCREVLVAKGMRSGTLPGPNSVLPGGAQAITVWTRVWRKGDDPSSAELHSEVFVQ